MFLPIPHSLWILGRLREQAHALCREAGRELPTSLLAEGLPGAADPPGISFQGPETEPHAPPPNGRSLDELRDRWVGAHPDRKGAGLYLTPPNAARALLVEAARDGWRPRSVLDFAVGAGVFLLEARALFGPGVALYGVDSDPAAVALTRLALWLAGAEEEPELLVRRIRWGDALSWGEGADGGGPPIATGEDRFDLICGNPPFGNAIEKRTSFDRERRRFLGERFADVAKGPYDRSVLFVRLAGGLLAEGGRIALLVPRALLAARYAYGLRDWSSRETPLTDLLRFASDAPCPDAAVTMVGWIARRHAAPKEVRIAPDVRPGNEDAKAAPTRRAVPRTVAIELLTPRSWGALLDPLAERIETVSRGHPLLGEAALVRAGASVSEGYEMAAEIVDGGAGWHLLTSGLITRYGDLWGLRRAQHLGRSYARPVLPFGARSVRSGRRDLYRSPKIVVCGLSRVIRARADATGECAGSVGSFLVLPRDAGEDGALRLRRLSILLNSAWYSMVHRARRGGLALSGGNVPLGRKDIEEFPLPSVFLDGGTSGTPQLALLDSLDPSSDDLLIQRLVLLLAGYDEEDATTIVDAWSGLTKPSARPRNS
jgi:hypothetical protein